MTYGSEKSNIINDYKQKPNTTMKRIVLLISVAAIALFASSSAYAQGKKYGATPEDSVECIKYLSYYTEYYKQKNYEAALPNWRKAYEVCLPTARYNMLTDGCTLLKRVIQANQKNVEYRDKLVDSLMTIYDKRIQYWPKHATSSLNRKGLDMYNYLKNDPEKLIAGLNEVVNTNMENTDRNIFLFQLNTAVDLYKEGSPNMDPEKVINIYENAIKYLGMMKPKNDIDANAISKAIEDVESLFITSQVASCENLISLFGPRFEADPQNLDLAKNVVRMMGMTEGCTDNDLFLKAINTMHSMEPSHTSAYYLYKLYSGRGDVDNAIKFIEEAIAAEESDAVTDGGYSYELAVYCSKNGKNAKAVSAANDAIKLDSSLSGKAYMLIGTIWGSIVCPGNDIEQRAKYWVAVDYMNKAKSADETLAEDANNMIRQYASYYPQTAEAFMYDVTNGQTYNVSCGGMTATTTVRTQN